MKQNEPFNPSVSSSTAPKGLIFRLATSLDRTSIAKLMSERNPTTDPNEIMAGTDKEISLNSFESSYRIFVAELNGCVVGLCRYYHSDGLPTDKIIYPSPAGWYAMGILVDSEFRRQGIARFLFHNRMKYMHAHGITSMYSLVDCENLTSKRMHESFGFEELERAPGFLHIRFESGQGILYRISCS